MKSLPKCSTNTESYKPARVLRSMLILIVTSLFQIAIADDAPARLIPGDVVVLDIGIGGDVGPEIVFRVDPATGTRTIFQNLRDIDPADQLLETNGIAVERSGNLLITESRLGPDNVLALYRLNAVTRERTLLTIFDFVSPDGKRRAYQTIDLAVENSGSVLVLVETFDPRNVGAIYRPSILYRVDTVTGIPTLLTDFAQISGDDPNVGPTYIGRAVAVDPSGNPVVAVSALTPDPPGTASLYRINPNNGLPTFIANFPDELNNHAIGRIEVEASGSILAVSQVKLYRFNQRTGMFSVLTDFKDGPFETHGDTPVDIALEASGNILVTDGEASRSSFNQKGSVWRIDPKSGARSVLSDFGLDPQGLNPYYIAVVPAAFVGFREFVPALDIDVRPGHNNDRFYLEAEVTLGDNSDGILPPQEIMTLRVGSYSVTLPAGAFKEKKHGRKQFRFHGRVNGVELDIILQSEKAKNYELMVSGRDAELSIIESPVPVTLTIGNDQGNASVEARIMP
jgi:hypothetical protein